MEGLTIGRSGASANVTLDNPPDNRLYPEMLSGLVKALRELDADPEINAIVVRGAGDTFCGGVDGARLQQGDPRQFATSLVELFKLIPELGTAVLAAVNGDALMSGFSLVCAVDVAVAVEGSRLGTIEASLGLWPTIAQVPVLHRLMPTHALLNVLSGEPFDARRAYEIGAVAGVVPAGELDAEVERWVTLCTRSKALGRGRRSAHRFLSQPYGDALDASYEEFTALFSTARPS